jgi:hypothetical protein
LLRPAFAKASADKPVATRMSLPRPNFRAEMGFPSMGRMKNQGGPKVFFHSTAALHVPLRYPLLPWPHDRDTSHELARGRRIGPDFLQTRDGDQTDKPPMVMRTNGSNLRLLLLAIGLGAAACVYAQTAGNPPPREGGPPGFGGGPTNFGGPPFGFGGPDFGPDGMGPGFRGSGPGGPGGPGGM